MKNYYLLLKRYHLLIKTAMVACVVMGTNVFGNYALKLGLSNGAGVTASWAPMQYIRALGHPWVIAGVALMLGWFLSRLVLLSWADLSYVLPVTAFSYVLSAMMGAFLLHEAVSHAHWAGICLITLGVGLTIFTRPGTTPPGGSEVP
jgi:uncharacterized membrane protein